MSTEAVIFIVMMIFSLYIGFRIGSQVAIKNFTVLIMKFQDILVNREKVITSELFTKTFVESSKLMFEDVHSNKNA